MGGQARTSFDQSSVLCRCLLLSVSPRQALQPVCGPQSTWPPASQGEAYTAAQRRPQSGQSSQSLEPLTSRCAIARLGEADPVPLATWTASSLMLGVASPSISWASSAKMRAEVQHDFRPCWLVLTCFALIHCCYCRRRPLNRAIVVAADGTFLGTCEGTTTPEHQQRLRELRQPVRHEQHVQPVRTLRRPVQYRQPFNQYSTQVPYLWPTLPTSTPCSPPAPTGPAQPSSAPFRAAARAGSP